MFLFAKEHLHAGDASILKAQIPNDRVWQIESQNF